jgi:hypothetical protein
MKKENNTVVSSAVKERDALHILPLGMIPIATPSLRQANLVKNAQLQTQVELYHGR